MSKDNNDNKETQKSANRVVFCPYVRPDDPRSYPKVSWRRRTVPLGDKDYFLPTNVSPLHGKTYQEMHEIEAGTYQGWGTDSAL